MTKTFMRLQGQLFICSFTFSNFICISLLWQNIKRHSNLGSGGTRGGHSPNQNKKKWQKISHVWASTKKVSGASLTFLVAFVRISELQIQIFTKTNAEIANVVALYLLLDKVMQTVFKLEWLFCNMTKAKETTTIKGWVIIGIVRLITG